MSGLRDISFTFQTGHPGFPARKLALVGGGVGLKLGVLEASISPFIPYSRWIENPRSSHPKAPWEKSYASLVGAPLSKASWEQDSHPWHVPFP